MVSSDKSVNPNSPSFVIENKEIRFKATVYQERVNFAVCFGRALCHNEKTNDVQAFLRQARLFHMPPIQYKEVAGMGYHLVVDMFDNGWVDRQVEVPYFLYRVGRNVPRTTDDDTEPLRNDYGRSTD